MQKESLFDSPATDDASQIKRLVFCVEQMIPWLGYAASQHPNSSHADRVLRHSMLALELAGRSSPIKSIEQIRRLEATEVDQLRRDNERLSSEYDRIWARFQKFKDIGKAMCECRSGQGVDDSKLYRQLEAVVSD